MFISLMLSLSLAWLPGLDIIVPIPGSDYVLGYDRDTRILTRLSLAGACYVTWPAPETGSAIIALIPLGPSQLVLYSEAGTLAIEAIPESFACRPVSKD